MQNHFNRVSQEIEKYLYPAITKNIIIPYLIHGIKEKQLINYKRCIRCRMYHEKNCCDKYIDYHIEFMNDLSTSYRLNEFYAEICKIYGANMKLYNRYRERLSEIENCEKIKMENIINSNQLVFRIVMEKK